MTDEHVGKLGKRPVRNLDHIPIEKRRLFEDAGYEYLPAEDVVGSWDARKVFTLDWIATKTLQELRVDLNAEIGPNDWETYSEVALPDEFLPEIQRKLAPV